METVWVTAQWVNDAKPTNPKNGSIKDPVLGYISVPVAALGQFQKGKRYCIVIETTDKGYRNFKGFANPQPNPVPQSTGGQFDGRQIPPAPQRVSPQPIARTLPPRPAAPQGRRIDVPMGLPVDPTAMNIFVTGIVGRALGSGHFSPADISELTAQAKAAFMVHLSGGGAEPGHQTYTPAPTPEQEFNDPLPDPSQYGAQPPVDDEWQQ